jgi:hypothetical protein
LQGSNYEPLMSALGQKQTLQSVRPMSALPPKADIGTQPRDVRFVPKADSCTAAKIVGYKITSSARSTNCSGIVKPTECRRRVRYVNSDRVRRSNRNCI